MLPTEPDQPSTTRISDAERTEVVELLRQHCSEGRLTLDEFSDRVGAVFAARTRGELDTVLADLPKPQQAPPAPERRRPVRKWVVGVMSGARIKGRWRPAEMTHVVAFMGGCEVDLRNAEIDGGEVRIRATAFMGGVEVIVPEGVDVELDGFALMGANERRIANVPVVPGAPVVRVQAFSFMGGVVVKSKPNRREGTHDAAYRVVTGLERAVEKAFEVVEARIPTPQEAATPVRLPPQAPGGTVTILFSDIEGFSAMTERLGDRKAQEVVRVHNRIVRGNVGACGGFEVKSQGDGFMLAFDSASKALRCAEAVQHELAAYNRAHQDEPIKVRMGLHTGEAIKDHDDFLGKTVIVASRIANEAQGGEILVSSLLRELVAGTGEFRFGEPREVELKGLSGTHTVVPVRWAD